MIELRNCPFCGSDLLHTEKFYVGCLSCGAIGSNAKSKQFAIKAWNTRADKVCKCTDQCGYDYCGNCGGKVEC